MSLATQSSKLLLALSLAALSFGCEEESARPAPAKPKPAEAIVAPPHTPSAEPPPKLREDCPKGSSGFGTLAVPCLGEGDSRMMEVKYTGKTTDEGPKFSVTNKSNSQLLFGSVAARS